MKPWTLGATMFLAVSGLWACGKKKVAAVDAGAPLAVVDAGPPAPPEPKGELAEWLRAKVPATGKVVATDAGGIAVVHTVAAGDTPLSIATAYVNLTDVYRAKELAAILTKDNGELAPGQRVTIPHLLSEPYKEPDKSRLPWPEDHALKGIFITGAYAGLYWPETINKLAARKLNAVVLDGKDYMGPITYPTKVKVAIETDAGKDPPIPDLPRAIRWAHAKGVRVIMRVACFHDPWAAKHAPRLSLMGNWGKPFPMGWMDPANVEAEDYILDLVREQIAMGADEIQLDYIRFPVQGRDIKSAVLPAPDGHRSQAIRGFVHRVHELTQAANIPLSLDIFGVAATGDLSDIEALGQNIATIGPEAEALSPMVYPSHYAPGYHGFDEPGNHPEIIGIGTRAALQKLKAGNVKNTVIRPWLQASSYKASAYGPKYIQEEIKSAETSGAKGWLMWDPENSYWAVWRALPVVE